MPSFILAKKLNMTQLFSQDGRVIPVTVLEARPCKVTHIKTEEKDKYQAVQVSLGHDKREFRVADISGFEVGKEITVASFTPGEVINITGVSKGRGFAGPMKRHGFHERQPVTVMITQEPLGPLVKCFLNTSGLG